MAVNKTSILLTADDRTRAAFESAKAGMASLESVAGRVNGLLSTLGVGAIAGGGLIAFAKSGIDAADSLNDMSQKIGISVEQLAGYNLAAESSGTSMEDFGKAAKQMAKSIAEGDPLLAKLGITSKDVNGALLQLADVFESMPDGANKTAVAMKLMGKSGADMIPLLNGGGDALRKMLDDGQRLYPVTTEMAKAADQFKDSLAKLKVQSEGLGIKFANALLPALNQAMEAADEASKRFGALGGAMVGIGTFGTIGQTLAVVWANVSYVFREVGVEIGGIAAQLAAIGRLDFKGAGLIGDAMKRDAAVARKELDDLERRIMGLGGKAQSAAAAAVDRPKKYRTGLFDEARKPAKERMSEVEWTMEESAHLIRTFHQIAMQMDKDAQGAFERAADAADAWTESLDHANKTLDDAARGYKDLIDPLEKYRRKLEEIDNLQESARLSADEAAQARMQVNAAMNDEFARMTEKATEANDIAKELGLTFTSAFEDAVVSGKKFSDVLRGVYQDILRLMLRETVTKPAAAAFSDLFKGVSFSSLIPRFATGTDYVPRDMLAVIHKGEAVIPAEQNRRGAMGGMTLNMTINTPDAASFRRSAGQIQAEMAFMLQGARRYS